MRSIRSLTLLPILFLATLFWTLGPLCPVPACLAVPPAETTKLGWVYDHVKVYPTDGEKKSSYRGTGLDWRRNTEVTVSVPSDTADGRGRINVRLVYLDNKTKRRYAVRTLEILVDPPPEEILPGESYPLHYEATYKIEEEFAPHDKYFGPPKGKFHGRGGDVTIYPAVPDVRWDLDLSKEKPKDDIEILLKGPETRFGAKAGDTLHINVKGDFEVQNTGITFVYVLGPVTVVEEKSKFWDWYVEHSGEYGDYLRRVSETRMALAAQARVRENKRAFWMKLLARDLTRDVMEGSEHRAERDVLVQEMRQVRSGQEKLIEKTLADLRKLREAAEKLVEAEPESIHKDKLEREIEALEKEELITELLLYDAAGFYEPHELPYLMLEVALLEDVSEELKEYLGCRQLIADAKNIERRIWLQRLSPNSAVDPRLAAKALQARGLAWSTVRGMLQEQPGLSWARTIQHELELYFLRQLRVKIQVEKELAFTAFGSYLTNRGVYEHDYRVWAWLRVQVYSGPISIYQNLQGAGLYVTGFDEPFLRLPGTSRVDAAELTTSTAQLQGATCLTGLLVATRLCERGFDLAEIGGMSTGEIAATLTADWKGPGEVNHRAVAALAASVTDTFGGLPELQSLAAGDFSAFQGSYRAALFARIDPDKSLAQGITDAMLNPVQLALLCTPAAVVKMADGAWATRAALKGGQEGLRMADLIAKAPRVKGVADAMMSTSMGQRFYTLMRAEQALEASSWTWTGTKLVGGFFGSAAASWGLNEAGYQKTAFLLDVVLSLGAGDLAQSTLTRSGTALRRLAGEVDDMGRLVALRRGTQAELERLLRDTEDALDAAEEGARQAAKAAKAAAEGGEAAVPAAVQGATAPTAMPDTLPGAGSRIATGQPDQDLAFAVSQAGVAVNSGQLSEATKAVAATGPLRQRLKNVLSGAEDLIARGRARLAALAGGVPPAVPTVRPVSKRLPLPTASRQAVYQAGTPGALMRQGDQALATGEWDHALRLYRDAVEALDHSTLGAVAEQSQDAVRAIIRSRLRDTRQAVEIRGVLSKLQATRSSGAGRAIESDDLDAVIAAVGRGEAKKLGSGGANPAWSIEVNGSEYILKNINPGQGDFAREVVEVMETEQAAVALASAVGLRAPAAAHANVGGEIGTAMVMRRVASGEARDQSLSVLLATKEDHALQRAFRAWIGDPDGHLSNQLLGGDGHLWMIDFDRANLLSNHHTLLLGGPEASAREMVSGVWHLSSIGDWATTPQYAWLRHMDTMVTPAEMKHAFDGIEQLCTKDGGQGLRAVLQQAFSDPEDVATAFRVLRERQRVLRNTAERYWSLPTVSPAAAPMP